MFFRFKLYGFFGLVFLLLILCAAAVRWLPLLHFQDIVAFDDRGRSVEAIAFLMPLFRDGFVRVVGEDSVLLWFASTVGLHELVLPGIDVVIDWWERRLTFHPVPQARILIWCIAEDCVWVSDAGVALDAAPSAEGQLVRRVAVLGGTLPSTGMRILPRESLRVLLRVFDFLETGSVSIANASFDVASSDLTIVTDHALTLFFNLRFDITASLQSFADVARSIDIARTQSIDFRVPQKIYYIPRI